MYVYAYTNLYVCIYIYISISSISTGYGVAKIMIRNRHYLRCIGLGLLIESNSDSIAAVRIADNSAYRPHLRRSQSFISGLQDRSQYQARAVAVTPRPCTGTVTRHLLHRLSGDVPASCVRPWPVTVKRKLKRFVSLLKDIDRTSALMIGFGVLPCAVVQGGFTGVELSGRTGFFVIGEPRLAVCYRVHQCVHAKWSRSVVKWDYRISEKWKSHCPPSLHHETKPVLLALSMMPVITAEMNMTHIRDVRGSRDDISTVCSSSEFCRKCPERPI